MANELAELAEGMDAGNERSLNERNNGTAKTKKAEEREGIVAQRRSMRTSSLWGLLPTGGQLTRTNARSVGNCSSRFSSGTGMGSSMTMN